jgi:hypothetical protein
VSTYYNLRAFLLAALCAGLAQQPAKAEQFEIISTKSSYCRVFKGREKTARIFSVQS